MKMILPKKKKKDFSKPLEDYKICGCFPDEIKKANFPQNVKKISVRIYETADNYAEEDVKL